MELFNGFSTLEFEEPSQRCRLGEPLMEEKIKTFTSNIMEYDSRHNDGAEGKAKYLHMKGLKIELIIATIKRIQNFKVVPWITMAISLVAYLAHMPRLVWAVLMHFRPIVSRAAVEGFAEHMTDDIISDKYGVKTGMVFLVFDNCDYFLRIKYVDAQKKAEMLHTVNWITVNLDHLDLDPCMDSGVHHAPPTHTMPPPCPPHTHTHTPNFKCFRILGQQQAN